MLYYVQVSYKNVVFYYKKTQITILNSNNVYYEHFR